MYEEPKFPTAQEARERSCDNYGLEEYLGIIKEAVERCIRAHRGSLTLALKKSPLCRDNPGPVQLEFRITKLRNFFLERGYNWIENPNNPLEVDIDWK